MILRGRVEAGLGKAGAQVVQSGAELASALGAAPVPGTLNVRLPVPFEPTDDARPIRVERFGQRETPFFLFPGRIGGHQVWVARSLSQIEVTDDLLEVLSTVHLRTALGLRDGDEVEIELL